MLPSSTGGSREDMGIRQDQIDTGLVPGLTSAERDELRAARRRIWGLEAELGIH